jgi:hypothetical protein
MSYCDMTNFGECQVWSQIKHALISFVLKTGSSQIFFSFHAAESIRV